MTYNVFSGTLNTTHFTPEQLEDDSRRKRLTQAHLEKRLLNGSSRSSFLFIGEQLLRTLY